MKEFNDQSVADGVLIGLHGSNSSGKHRVLHRLKYKHQFRSYAFGDMVQELLAELDPFVAPSLPLSQVLASSSWEDVLENRLFGQEAESLLKRLDQGVTDRFGEGAWAKALANDINNGGGIGPGQKVTVSDVRTPEEARWIRSNHGQVWHVSDKQTVPSKLPQDLIDHTIYATDYDRLPLTVDALTHALLRPRNQNTETF